MKDEANSKCGYRNIKMKKLNYRDIKMKQGWSLLNLDDGSENFVASTKLKVLVCLHTCLTLFQKAVTCTILAPQRMQQHYTAGLISSSIRFFSSTISEWNKLD